MVLPSIFIVENSNAYMKMRIEFPKGNQRRFIKNFYKNSNKNWEELANLLNIPRGTLCIAYKYEYCKIPELVFKKIARILNREELELLKEYRGSLVKEVLPIGRKVLGERKTNTKPIKIIFKSQNLTLDISRVNFSRYDIKKGLKLPNKITQELAEEIGMHYGDGFLSSRKFDYRLKGNQYTEREYYCDYIKPLFKNLYNLDVSLKDYKTSFGFEIYSQALWEFKNKILGIKSGNKRNLVFPKILKVNNMGILASFLRGLFDTDGSVSFKTQYGYKSYYPVISIRLISKEIIKEVEKILEMLGLEPRVYFNENYGSIYLNGINKFNRYRELIGWSSPKNLNKIKEWEKRYPQLNKMADVVQGLVCATVARETRVRLPPSALSYPNRELNITKVNKISKEVAR